MAANAALSRGLIAVFGASVALVACASGGSSGFGSGDGGPSSGHDASVVTRGPDGAIIPNPPPGKDGSVVPGKDGSTVQPGKDATIQPGPDGGTIVPPGTDSSTGPAYRRGPASSGDGVRPLCGGRWTVQR